MKTIFRVLILFISMSFALISFSDTTDSTAKPNMKAIGFGCDKDLQTKKCLRPYMIMLGYLPKAGEPVSPNMKLKPGQKNRKIVGMGCDLDKGQCDQMYVIMFVYQDTHMTHPGHNAASEN